MNILFLCTFPVENASHGGQIRLLNLIKLLKSDGHKVELIGVCGSQIYNANANFVDFPSVIDLNSFCENSFLMEDYAIGKMFEKSDKHFNLLAEKITFVPDLIHVQMPWLFGFATKYRKLKKLNNVKIIYGSENVEYDVKYQILKNYLPVKECEKASSLVKDMELKAIKNADASCAVAEGDFELIKNNSDKPVVMAPNGVSETTAEMKSFRKITELSGTHKYVTYYGSGYPPNVIGFFELFKNGLTFLKPNERMIFAGGLGDAIYSDKKSNKLPRLFNGSKNLGIIDEDILDALVENAHVIALPITSGSGTSLKTAQALRSGNWIVATSIAMRGFEEFSSDSGVIIADNADSFVSAIRNCMDSERLELSKAQINSRKKLLWKNTLSEYKDMISKIMKVQTND